MAANIIVLDASVASAVAKLTTCGVYADSDKWYMTVFGEGAYRGNTALVHYSPYPLSQQSMQTSARLEHSVATCFVWAVNSHKQSQIQGGVFASHCYGKGGLIKCCGHGLLACAHVVASLPEERRLADLQQYHGDDDKLAIAPGVLGDASHIAVKFCGGRFCVEMPRLPCQSVVIPPWVQNVFDEVAVAAAIAGDDHDYLVLEWPANANLAKLQVDLLLMAQVTQRAVIITQGSLDTAFDFKLRYFAPQYGVDEDAVTGSANRVLADYWFRKTGQRRFRALQCSAQGGIVYSELSAQRVSIAGNTQLALTHNEPESVLLGEAEQWFRL